jgi:uncharacterized membrane protein YuzA (DUF378 family)
MVFSMLADVLGVDEGTAMMLSQLLVAVGAINWGLIGFSGLTGMESFNLVTTLLGEGLLTDVVYTLVGAAGLDVASDLLY